MPIDPPDHAFAEITWHRRSAVAVSESAFTFAQKTYKWPGQGWRAEVKLPVMEREKAGAWSAFFAKLNGREGTFNLGCSVRKTSAGAPQGTPLVDGATQNGGSIDTDGWDASITGQLKAGDMIQIGSKLYEVLDDVDSDGTGDATINIWPDIPVGAEHADNAPVITQNAKGVFRLDAMPKIKWTTDQLLASISFSCSEVIGSA